MDEPNKSNKQSWWFTLPGILTGIAAILTAITGLVIGLQQAGFFSSEKIAQQSTPINSTSTGPSTSSPPKPKATVTLANGATSIEGSPVQSRDNPQHAITSHKGMGILRTSSGEIEFDWIENQSMGRGNLTVFQFGAKVEIPIKKIKSITFGDEQVIRIDYWNGDSEETLFHCYWNLPVRFHAGDKVIYYGNCNDFQAVKQIEFYRRK